MSRTFMETLHVFLGEIFMRKKIKFSSNSCSGFRVPVSGFRVPGSGFRVPGSGFRVPGSG